jgi:hypothetical protein
MKRWSGVASLDGGLGQVEQGMPDRDPLPSFRIG